MALVVVGGHTRNVGKTSVVAGLIAAMPERRWLAMKITQYGHGICSRNGKQCQCASADHSWAINEERDPTGDSDTSRFLAAGADRVYWVRTQQGHLLQAMPGIVRKCEGTADVILESNSVMQFVEPDLYLSVIDPSVPDFKTSARKYLERADAVILHTGSTGDEDYLQGKRTFWIDPPTYVTEELTEFVRASLGGAP